MGASFIKITVAFLYATVFLFPIDKIIIPCYNITKGSFYMIRRNDMKIKRWMILTAVFAVLAGSIAASGCQTSNTASTANAGGSSNNTTNDCIACSNCTVAGQSYNCNDPDQCDAYIVACTANCEFNGKTYNCTTLGGCISFWGTFACDMCLQTCKGANQN